METQLNIRNNVLELQEYIKDLHDWEKEIKKKDKGASRHGTTSTSKANGHAAASNDGVSSSTGSALPAPRGRALTTVAAAPAELQKPGLLPKSSSATCTSSAASTSGKSSDPASKAEKTAAAHTYTSYKKWDKFDVDAALASDDSDQEGQLPRQSKPAKTATTPKPDSSSITTPTLGASASVTAVPRQPISITSHAPAATPQVDMTAISTTHAPMREQPSSSQQAEKSQQQHPPIRNSEPQTADAWRTRGNDLFKVGQHLSAKHCYTNSILLEPSSLAYANRAMAEIKLQEWEAAEEDCTAALALDPAYIKALHRRGTARKQLGKLMEAAEDFEAALRYEPSNKAVQSDLEAAVAHYMQQNKLQPLSKRTKLQVQVKQAASPAPPAPPTPAATYTAAGATSPTAGAPKTSVVSPTATSAAPTPATPTAPAAPAVHAASTKAAVTSAATLPAADATAPAPAPTAAGTERSALASRVAAAANVAAEQAASRMLQSCKAPRTSTEFENAWRSFKGDTAQQAAYLRLITPSQLPAIFKSSLTPQVLSSVLNALLSSMGQHPVGQASSAEDPVGQASSAEDPVGQASSAEDAPFCVELLQHLTAVPRFDMTAMCIASKDKRELALLWDRAAAAAVAGGAAVSQQLALLKKKFKL